MNRPPSDAGIRLGAIAFINTLPVYWGMAPGADSLNITYAAPAVLNRMMAAGELDVSPVSSAFYLRHQSDLVLLDDLSVSSPGAVESVLFLCQKPLTAGALWDLAEDRIAVPDESETSVALLAHLLARQTGQPARAWQSRFVVYPAAEVDQALADCGNVLVIGDNALALSHGPTVAQYFYYDLAALWAEETGLPFVFAVWVAPKAWAADNADALLALNQSLCHRRDVFFTDEAVLTEALELACERCGLNPAQARHYFTRALTYRLEAPHRASLRAFETVLSDLDTPQTQPTHTAGAAV